MEKFERLFGDLDVHTSVMDSTMSSATTLNTPEDQVTGLMRQVGVAQPFQPARLVNSVMPSSMWCVGHSKPLHPLLHLPPPLLLSFSPSPPSLPQVAEENGMEVLDKLADHHVSTQESSVAGVQSLTTHEEDQLSRR